MNETDLSDEAFSRWYAQVTRSGPVTAKMGWSECRRRAQEEIALLKQWIEVKDKALKMLHSMREEERREAFEAGIEAFHGGRITIKKSIEEAYRAFLQEREK